MELQQSGRIITLESILSDPYIIYYRERQATSYLLRGELLTLLGELGPATAELTRSLKVSRELIDRFGGLSGSMLVRARTFLALGNARAAAGKDVEALPHWKNAATEFGLGLKVDPDDFQHRRGLAEAEQAQKRAGN
jgi:hypothetical protein